MNTRHLRTAMALFALCAGMVMLAYASVPLYRLFCQVTGFGGTVRESDTFPETVLNRRITIRFNADHDPAIPWRFTPDQVQLETKIGAPTLAFYTASNQSDQPVKGMATYNVTPMKAGAYFHKVACFCFEEQTLGAKETLRMPVSFYVDPSIVDDPDMQDVHTITLSYTFFKVKE